MPTLTLSQVLMSQVRVALYDRTLCPGHRVSSPPPHARDVAGWCCHITLWRIKGMWSNHIMASELCPGASHM